MTGLPFAAPPSAAIGVSRETSRRAGGQRCGDARRRPRTWLAAEIHDASLRAVRAVKSPAIASLDSALRCRSQALLSALAWLNESVMRSQSFFHHPRSRPSCRADTGISHRHALHGARRRPRRRFSTTPMPRESDQRQSRKGRRSPALASVAPQGSAGPGRRPAPQARGVRFGPALPCPSCCGAARSGWVSRETSASPSRVLGCPHNRRREGTRSAVACASRVATGGPEPAQTPRRRQPGPRRPWGSKTTSSQPYLLSYGRSGFTRTPPGDPASHHSLLGRRRRCHRRGCEWLSIGLPHGLLGRIGCARAVAASDFAPQSARGSLFHVEHERGQVAQPVRAAGSGGLAACSGVPFVAVRERPFAPPATAGCSPRVRFT
jgi:hypothetical protein